MKIAELLKQFRERLGEINRELERLDEERKVLVEVVAACEKLAYLESGVVPQGKKTKARRTRSAAIDTHTASLAGFSGKMQGVLPRTSQSNQREAQQSEKRKRTVYSDEVKQQAFDLMAEGKSVAEIARTLQIGSYAIYDWKARAKWDGRYQKFLPSSVDQPEPGLVKPIRAHDHNTPEKNGTDARKTKLSAQVRQPVRNHSCGNCVTRYVDDTPYFSAQPDCPEHGLGLGIAQEGRERKAPPPAVN